MEVDFAWTCVHSPCIYSPPTPTYLEACKHCNKCIAYVENALPPKIYTPHAKYQTPAHLTFKIKLSIQQLLIKYCNMAVWEFFWEVWALEQPEALEEELVILPSVRVVGLELLLVQLQ